MNSIENKILSAVDNRLFELILFPTEKCNFRCTYCYEDFKIGKMGRPVIDGVKALISRKFESVVSMSINWFGGEPLLALPIIDEISEHVISLTKLHQHVIYDGWMTTNGYLLKPEVFKHLTALGIVHFQVSLDGDEAVHDATRKMVKGGSTFARIWDNLLSIHESQIEADILLRIHLTRDNLQSVEGLLEKIGLELRGDYRFKVYFKLVEKLGGPNDASLPVLSHAEQDQIISRLGDLIASSIRVINFQPEVGPEICYASKANSLAIRADGRIAKCTVALYDERNTVGQIQEDGRILLDREKLLPWLRGLETLDPEELSCPYRGLPSQHEPPLP